jgi:hypothetical protein
MKSVKATSADPLPPQRSAADLAMLRFLRINPDAPPKSIFGSENAFGKSIAVSAMRCTVTYLLLPLLAPIVDLTHGVTKPIVGLLLGAISMTAIALSMRRFFASNHKWRWGYSIVGGSIFVALAVMALFDLRELFLL